MPLTVPDKIPLPWASTGINRTDIPTASQIGVLPGAASWTDGFPPLTMTPIASGGIPPAGPDFNGVLYALSRSLQWSQAGAQYPYDAAFAAAIGGYPLGALVQRTDGTGAWRTTTANNSTDPEAFGAGWVPEGVGITSVAMSNANVTLTALQAARNTVIITGALTANLNLIFPTYQKQWLVVNNATGAFSVTAKTAAGSGVAIATGASATVYGDGTNIANSFAISGQPQMLLTASQATTSGTFVDITGIPSWAKRVTINFTSVSLSGTSHLLIQVGNSGGFPTTGYDASSSSLPITPANIASTSGFPIRIAVASASVSGHMAITLGATCTSSHAVNRGDGNTMTGGGTGPFPASMDRIRITTVNGTDTFDAGSVSLLIEGY